MTKKFGKAVVVGGSIAGLLAARALSNHFDEVIVLERDKFAAGPEPRPGVPQGAHIHAVLTRGRNLLEDVFPGLVDEVVAAGAIMIDHINDRKRLASYGWQPRFPSELRMLLVSRPLLEFHVRRRALALPNLTIRDGSWVRNLTLGADGAINGVIVSATADDGDETTIHADLVVDAAGRSSNAHEWMEELGFGAVTEMLVDAKWGYASRFFEMPADWPHDWKLINMWPQIRRTDAQKTRGGVLCPQDGGRCIVTLVGNAGDVPPRDEAGFLKFAESLASPEIAEFVRTAKPVSPISISRTTVNKWRRYDQLERKPEGFIAIGDAVAAFNPVYGQGMSCAALEAQALDVALGEWAAGGSGSLSGFAPMAQLRIVATGTFPWGASTGSDSLVEGCVGATPPSPEARAYSERVVALGATENDYVLKFEEMANLVRDGKWMQDPQVKQRVIKDWHRLGDLVKAPAVDAPAA